MKNSVIDLHLSSTYHAQCRLYRLNHCQMVSWLMDNGVETPSLRSENNCLKHPNSDLNVYK
jgi:hypothetical protein